MWTANISRTIVDVDTGQETLYSFSVDGVTEQIAIYNATVYGSMVEYALLAERWIPGELPFPKEQLYQFIQPSQLSIIERMYPDVITTAYQNANAYVQSYIGNMFNVDEMLETGGTTSSDLTLRLALAEATAMFILMSTPQNSDTTEMMKHQLHVLLRGLKSGSRNFGKNAIVADPDVRVTIVDLNKSGSRP